MFCRKRESASMPPCMFLNESLMNVKVFFSLPMPSVISAGSTLLSGSILSRPTQSKMSLMMSDGFWSFLSSFKVVRLDRVDRALGLLDEGLRLGEVLLGVRLLARDARRVGLARLLDLGHLRPPPSSPPSTTSPSLPSILFVASSARAA